MATRKRPIFLNALACNNKGGTPPVWLMRQAGRYMGAYRRLKERHSFTQLCLTPELVVEVTLQPVAAFDVDAAILFSDILFPLMVFGIDPVFEDGHRPHLTGPSWDTLHPPVDFGAALREKLFQVYEAAAILSSTLDRPLIGFAAAPWTLAAFLLEGGASSSWTHAKNQAFSPSPAFLQLIRWLEELSVAHLNCQIQAGCDAIQIFDSLAPLLPASSFCALSADPIRRIVEQLPPTNVIVSTASSSTLAPLVQTAGGTLSAISCDSSVDLATVRKVVPAHIAVQGNLDPTFLLTSSETLVHELRRICHAMRGDPGFIFNLSKGVPPNTDESIVRLLIETVRERGGW